MRPIQILLVEDNPGDVELAQESFETSKITNEMHVCRDGTDALRYLRKEDPHEGAARPDLVLLDLNLPKLDGKAVLAALKGDPELRQIPVVVLTSSDAERDIIQSYDLGANCYVVKPLALAQFEQIVNAIDEFWFSVVRLPPR